MRLCKHGKTTLTSITYFPKMHENVRHNRVYILLSEHSYRLISTRVASQLSYYGKLSHNIAKFHASENLVWQICVNKYRHIPGHVIYAKHKSDHQLFQRHCLNKPGHSDSSWQMIPQLGQSSCQSYSKNIIWRTIWWDIFLHIKPNNARLLIHLIITTLIQHSGMLNI